MTNITVTKDKKGLSKILKQGDVGSLWKMNVLPKTLQIFGQQIEQSPTIQVCVLRGLEDVSLMSTGVFRRFGVS